MSLTLWTALLLASSAQAVPSEPAPIASVEAPASPETPAPVEVRPSVEAEPSSATETTDELPAPEQTPPAPAPGALDTVPPTLPNVPGTAEVKPLDPDGLEQGLTVGIPSDSEAGGVLLEEPGEPPAGPTEEATHTPHEAIHVEQDTTRGHDAAHEDEHPEQEHHAAPHDSNTTHEPQEVASSPASQAPTKDASPAMEASDNPGWLSGFPVPARGPVPAFTWAIWVLFWAWFSGVVGRMHARTTPESTVSSLLRLIQQGARGAGIASALLSLGAILPAPLAALIPVMLIGAALAMGWSLVSWLPDIWGGLLLAVEQPLEPGQWVKVGSAEGEVQWVGMRSTLVKDRSGKTMRIPNSALVSGPLSIDEIPWPAAVVTVETPSTWTEEHARMCIHDAAWMSAFIAPGEDISILQTVREPPAWEVRARIVDTRFADDFQATLLARIRAAQSEPPHEAS